MRTHEIIVVGGGAAGMMAAGQAAQTPKKVILFEKMKHLGMKLKITGKGRCNLTNEVSINEFIPHFGMNGRFLHQAFAEFNNQDLMEFFQSLGLKLVRERGGRVFPANGSAQDIVSVLKKWLNRNHVEVKLSSL